MININAQKSVEGKSGKLVAVQKLLEEMNINGTMIVSDALNYQKETETKKKKQANGITIFQAVR